MTETQRQILRKMSYFLIPSQIFRSVNLYNLVGENLHEVIASCSTQFRKAIDRDIQLNVWTNLDLVEEKDRELLKTFDYFDYYYYYFDYI